MSCSKAAAACGQGQGLIQETPLKKEIAGIDLRSHDILEEDRIATGYSDDNPGWARRHGELAEIQPARRQIDMIVAGGVEIVGVEIRDGVEAIPGVTIIEGIIAAGTGERLAGYR